MTEEILIIATSGRALAQSAARSGRRVRVLDAFADRDTCLAAEVQSVAVDGAIALDAARLFAALDEPRGRSRERSIVVGSGLERWPQMLDRLGNYGVVCANDADIVAALKDPDLGIELLRTLGWKVPETRRDAPTDLRGWLQKEIGGAGGVHVRRAPGISAGPRAFYQREVPGRALSVTFLADAVHAWMLGFNMLSFRAMGDAPFCYAGASTCSVEPSLAREMQLGLDRLVRATGLRGLNGIDLLLDGSDLWVLEVNPRPTATFELYDSDYVEGLVDWHIRSFAGPLSDFPGMLSTGSRRARACAIVYADAVVRVPDDANFPSWCRDLPTAGSVIRAGAPVLSVFAEANDQQAAQHLLQQRQREAHKLLDRWLVDWPAECPA